MSTWIICLIILAAEGLPISSWLSKRGLAYMTPLFFTIILIVTFVLPLIDFDNIVHWYDQVIALAAFVFQWAVFFIRDEKTAQH